MRMELDALDLRMVFPEFLLFLREAVDKKHILVLIGIETDRTPYAHIHALLEFSHDGLKVLIIAALAAFRLEELLAADAVRLVRDAEGEQLRARFERDGLEAGARTLADEAFQDDVLHLAVDLGNLLRLAVHAATEDQVASSLHDHGLTDIIRSRGFPVCWR